jgi:hypothetical protein
LRETNKGSTFALRKTMKILEELTGKKEKEFFFDLLAS